MKGNNKKGRTGGLRCTECRKVHLKVISAFSIVLKIQCIFSDENNPCTRCQSRGLACKKVLGEKGEASRVVKNSVSTVSIPRSPSAPGYIAIPADEQHGIHFLYTADVPWNYGIKFVTAMRRRGIYVQDPCLRYAMLAFSADLQSNVAKRQLYWSQFESAIRKISRRQVARRSSTCVDFHDRNRSVVSRAGYNTSCISTPPWKLCRTSSTVVSTSVSHPKLHWLM